MVSLKLYGGTKTGEQQYIKDIFTRDTTEHNYGYHYEQGIEPVNSFYENISGVWNLESFTLTDELGTPINYARKS